MKRVHYLQINGEEWKLTFKSKKSMPKNLMGLAHLTDNEIWILAGMTELQTRQTIFHEIIHVFFHDSGLAGTMTAKQEEALCDAIGKFIGNFLFNNKEFFQ